MHLDAYLLLKAAHIAAAMTFFAGVLLASITLHAAERDKTVPPMLLAAVRRWDVRVTTPAMLLVWALGLTLTLLGHWLPSGWLIAKLILVALLSGLHGTASGRLRRLAAGLQVPSRGIPPSLVVGAATIIAFLVVVKPF